MSLKESASFTAEVHEESTAGSHEHPKQILQSRVQINPKLFHDRQSTKKYRINTQQPEEINIPMIESKKEKDILGDSIVDLYLSLKGRAVLNKDKNNDRKKLLSLGNPVLIGYIRSFFEILLSQLESALEKVNQQQQYSESSSIIAEDPEKIIIRLESEVRDHIGVQQ